MRKSTQRAFSLVEVVLALAIISFAVMVLLGIFSVGLNTNRESVEELEATHIAQSMLAERRAAPVVDNATLVLPQLNAAAAVAKDSPVLLTQNGTRTTEMEDARYGMIYRINPAANGNSSQVYVCLFWPAPAGADNAQGRVEMITNIPL